MIHSLSSNNFLTPNSKKRKVSVTKRSTQKPPTTTLTPTQSTTKLSHKQNKQKILAMQNFLDEQQYKTNLKKLYSLNDRNLFQALNQQLYKQANTILQQIKLLIDVLLLILQIIIVHHIRPQQETLLQPFICLSLQQGIHSPTVQQIYYHIQNRQGESQQSAKQMQLSIRNFQNAQGYILSREENLAHTSQWVKLNLQYFTTLSNVNKHLEAIVSAEKCIQKISQSFRMLDAICAENFVYSDTPQTIATQSQSRVKSEMVNFKRIVIKQAQKILKQVDISSPHKLITENKDKFQQKMYILYKQIRKNMYFWKTNMQNNTKLAQKQLLQKGKQSTSSGRNLLGVQKTSNFTEQFSLGQLMNLSTKRMKQKLNIDQYFLLSSPKIVQLILFASVCYFTIATQTRFKELSGDINSLKITQKYQRLNKDEVIFKCKVLHLKAIQLAAKHLPQTNTYFTHILNSFNKNYKSVLDEINQESQSSMKSYNKSLEKYKKQQQAESDGLNQQYGMRNVHAQNHLHLSSKTQKRQLAEKNQKLEKNAHQNNMIKTMLKKRTTSKDKQTLSKRKVSTTKKN